MSIFPADVREAEKVEGFRFIKSLLLTGKCREAAKPDQSGLVRIELQRELLQPLPHHSPETARVSLILKADHDIVRITHDNHIACSLASSPTFGPQVEGVVQVDIGKQR